MTRLKNKRVKPELLISKLQIALLFLGSVVLACYIKYRLDDMTGWRLLIESVFTVGISFLLYFGIDRWLTDSAVEDKTIE